MNAWQKKVLTKNHVQIMKDLEPKDVIDHLIAEEIFDLDQAEEILVKQTRADRARQFMLRLTKKGPKAYDAFLESLKDKYNTVLEILKNYEESLPEAEKQPDSRLINNSSEHAKAVHQPIEEDTDAKMAMPVQEVQKKGNDELWDYDVEMQNGNNDGNAASDKNADAVEWLNNLPVETHERRVTSQELVPLAYCLGDQWVPLAHVMGFQGADIDRFRGINQWKIHIQASEMLHGWQQRAYKNATVGNLVKYLIEAHIGFTVYKDVFKV